MPTLYFEDFEVGRIFDCAPHKMTRDEIIAFASEYDPQPFHLDEQAAKDTFFGALVASGWHTASLTMRALADRFLLDSSGIGSPGIEELRWVRPVRVDDVISFRCEVAERKESRSKPDMGLVRFSTTVTNQSGEIVMTQDNWVMFSRRDDAR